MNCGILTQSDDVYFDHLRLLVYSLSKTNRDVPIVCADSGLSVANRRWCLENGVQLKSFSPNRLTSVMKYKSTWLSKPRLFLTSPFERTIYIDADCCVVGSLSDVFADLDDLLFTPESFGVSAISETPYFLLRNIRPERYINSGIFGYNASSSLARRFLDSLVLSADAASKSPEILSTLWCMDQDLMQELVGLHGLERFIHADDTLNFPANGALFATVNCRKVYSMDYSVAFDEVVRDHPGVRIVHWPFMPKAFGHVPGIKHK